MKHISLQQAMLGMRVVLTDTGMLIKSPAGSAEYDLKGRRTKVNGCPEYFPGQLRVKDKRTSKKGRVTITDKGFVCYRADGSVGVKVGFLDTPDASGKKYATGGVAGFGKQVQFLAESFAVHDGKVFINEAFLKPGNISSSLQAAKDAQAIVAQTARQDAASANLQIAIANIDEAIRDTIRKEMQPGGAIWQGIRSR